MMTLLPAMSPELLRLFTRKGLADSFHEHMRQSIKCPIHKGDPVRGRVHHQKFGARVEKSRREPFVQVGDEARESSRQTGNSEPSKVGRKSRHGSKKRTQLWNGLGQEAFQFFECFGVGTWFAEIGTVESGELLRQH